MSLREDREDADGFHRGIDPPRTVPSDEAAAAWARGNEAQAEYERQQREIEQRRASEGVLGDPAASEDREWPIETASGEVVFVTSPETRPDLIQIRRPELQDLLSAGYVYEVLTGRTIISWRLRTPEDGDAAFVTEPARPKRPATDLKRPEEGYLGWKTRFYRGERDRDTVRIWVGYGKGPDAPTSQSDQWLHRRRSNFAGWGN
jgi:hypothetical protein